MGSRDISTFDMNAKLHLSASRIAPTVVGCTSRQRLRFRRIGFYQVPRILWAFLVRIVCSPTAKSDAAVNKKSPQMVGLKSANGPDNFFCRHSGSFDADYLGMVIGELGGQNLHQSKAHP